MLIPIILFVVGAIFGFYLLTHVLRNMRSPKMAMALHGLFVAVALVMVILAYLRGEGGYLFYSMIAFVIAALGGIIMSMIDLFAKKAPPKFLAILHPIVAVIGLVLLLIYQFGGNVS